VTGFLSFGKIHLDNQAKMQDLSNHFGLISKKRKTLDTMFPHLS